ncbi:MULTISPECIES: serine hydrolase domain-containing protein [Bacillus]|uniref:Penicillin-binding protein n=2 Tax=Bacillus TaxID=1386 RepID=A0A0M4G7V1_9BACI|nr:MULTISPECIES: serine hydrolase [Bacillus]ALC81178.1 penicillin-binding protein [Bacillus gobiensis]MBP1080157.1 CubicO group peptidase (beta-lactamase class C family) [Bacillus capparidis]MED1095538.1 serine hydrolase [Bacillus capparidis]
MELTKRIEEIVSNYNDRLPFSGAIFIQNEKKIFEKGFGYANRSEHLPITTRTRFGMASGCKIFTSVAICQLVEKEIITFDTCIKDCLDISFQHFHPSITIHHLLTHTSGIPDYFDEEVMSDFEELWKAVPMYSIQSPNDFLPMFQDQQMKFQPGSKFSYSNAGFILLGLIVEKMTGITFQEYVKENIFQVCEMTDSGFFRMDQLPERTALGYIDHEDGTWRTNIYSVPIIGGPDGGAFTTVLDLAKFWNGLFDRKLLGKEYVDKLLSPYVKNEGLCYGYGVWMAVENDEVLKYFIFGYDPGVRVHSSVNKKTKIQSHILSNIEQSVIPIVTGIDQLFSEKSRTL